MYPRNATYLRSFAILRPQAFAAALPFFIALALPLPLRALFRCGIRALLLDDLAAPPLARFLRPNAPLFREGALKPP
jgi:hypothetical protein